jgi:hypothetical protein
MTKHSLLMASQVATDRSERERAVRRGYPVSNRLNPKNSAFRTMGIWRARRGIAILQRFQNLVRHHLGIKFPGEPALVPLEELIPGETGDLSDQMVRRKAVEREINRLIPVVSDILVIAGVDAVFERTGYEDAEFGRSRKKVTVPIHIIEHSFNETQLDLDAYRFLMQTIERGVGAYQARYAVARREALSPISWAAWIVGLPLTVMNRAGFDSAEAASTAATVWGWVIRFVMLTICLLIATRVGVSIPWKELLESLLTKL